MTQSTRTSPSSHAGIRNSPILSRLFISKSGVSLLAAVTFLFAAAPDSANPAAEPDSNIVVDKMVVTASRTQRRASETSASISVITKAEIQAAPAKTIEDLLLTQTGVQVRRSVSIGEGIPSDIVMRGIPGALAATRTLILVDGIPTNASGTPFLIVNSVPMEAVDRIEIVRGPNSSLYGANAVGGVINIITQEGSGRPRARLAAETSYPFNVLDKYFSEDIPAFKAIRTSGTPAYWNANGTASGGGDRFGIAASGGYRAIGNYHMRDHAPIRNGEIVVRKNTDNSDYSEYRFLGKGRFLLSDKNDVSLHVRYFNSDLGFGKTKQILPDSQDVTTKGQMVLVGPQAKISLSDNILLRAGAYVRRTTGEFYNEDTTAAPKNTVRSYRKFATDDWEAEVRGTFTLEKTHVVTAGVEFLENRADFGPTTDPATGELLPSSFPRKASIENGAVFVQDELKPVERVDVISSARLDYHSQFGGALSPKLGISYKVIGPLRVRASAGRAFRAPSLGELYLDVQINPTVHLKPNPDLNPEYVWGYDAGVDISPLPSLILKIGPFYNSMRDFIGLSLDLGSTAITHRNISSAWSRGIETEIEWRPWKGMLASVNGVVQDSRDIELDAPLDCIPHYSFGGQLNVSRALGKIGIDGRISYNHVGERTFVDIANARIVLMPDLTNQLRPPSVGLDPYNRLDASFTISIARFWSRIGVQNILDEEIETYPGTYESGVFPTVTIGYTL